MGMSANEIAAKAVTLRNGVTVLNFTGGHPLTFLHSDGSTEEVAFCGLSVSAARSDEVALLGSVFTLVRTKFLKDEATSKILDELCHLLPLDTVFLGSVIAAQVYSLQMVVGIQVGQTDRSLLVGERVYYIHPDRFTTFFVGPLD